MIYSRRRLQVQISLDKELSDTAIENLNKYFDKINAFKLIVVYFNCSAEIASDMSKKLRYVAAAFHNKRLIRTSYGSDNCPFTTVTLKELVERCSKDEALLDIELEDSFICANRVDTVSIINDKFFYGTCDKKEFVCSLSEKAPEPKLQCERCTSKDCKVESTKANIDSSHAIKDVCLEDPMFYIKWRLFNECNYHCSYCIRKDLQDKKFPGISTLIERAHCLSRMTKPFRLELIGGEVTLIDLKALMSEIKTSALKAVYVSTNFSKSFSYFEELASYLHSRNVKLELSCSLHETECDENEFISKAEGVANFVDKLYIECVSTDENSNTIEKLLNVKNDKIKISLDYLRDRQDNIIAKKSFDVSNKKEDIFLNGEKIHHSQISGFVSVGHDCRSNGLYIDIDGSVYRRSCKQKTKIADIKDFDFSIKDDVISCPNSICMFSCNVEVF